VNDCAAAAREKWFPASYRIPFLNSPSRTLSAMRIGSQDTYWMSYSRPLIRSALMPRSWKTRQCRVPFMCCGLVAVIGRRREQDGR